MSKRNKLSRFYTNCILGMTVVFFVGCGAVTHTSKFEPDFLPKANSKVEVGTVVNDTGKTFEVDTTKMLTDALTDRLKKENLCWLGSSDDIHLIIESKIVEYDEGNAFKRWLLPGWGATVLSVRCELRDGTSKKIVGHVDARRTVSAGGAYTIGAWETIFGEVAEDVTKELRSKIAAK